MFERFITRLAFILFGIIVFMAISNTAKANDLFIYYSSNESTQYSNLKSHYESLGFTVTGSTSTTVSSSDVSGKELVIDIAGNSNCGSTCRSVYDSYVSGGGKLIIAAENGATNRIGNIESLIENKMQVGSYTAVVNANDSYQNVRYGDYASSTASENYLPGADGYFTSATGGETVATNSANNTTYKMWYKWDYGTNGGSVYVTFGYGQFSGTVGSTANNNNFDAFLTSIATEEGLYSSTPTYTSSISSTQTTLMNNARGVTHDGNGIYITQSGSNNSLNITQDGTDNLIAGPTTTTNSIVDANITGNNNTTTMTQRGDNNVILFDVTGDYNSTTVNQGGASGADDNRILMDINGDHNTISSTQTHNDGIGNNGHFLSLDVDGNYNNILTSQTNDGDKKAFISAQGNSNDIDLYQQGTGSHYVEIDVGSNQTVDVTQDGSGNHNASISMTGYSATLDLTQNSSTGQTYSINQNCLTSTGCGTTTMTQQ